MSNEKFCLRWNDFENNISSAFRELRDDKDFFDVTLACDDDQIQAHKVILSACSPFFRNILRRNIHQHPLLYLKGVKYTDLQSVLNFMYHGEVNIAQEELNSFLAVAEDLRVKGLTQNQSGRPKPSLSPAIPARKVNQSLSKPALRVTDHEPPPPLKRPRPEPPVSVSYPPQLPDDDDIQEVVQMPIKSEPRETQMVTSQAPPPAPVYTSHQPVALQQEDEQSLETYQEESQAYDDYGQYEGDQYGVADTSMGMQGFEAGKGMPAVGEVTSPDDLYQFCLKSPGQSKWRCGICSEYTNNGRNHVRNHVESKHFPNTFQYQCPQCDKTCNTKKGLDVHKSEKHRNSLNTTV